MRLTLRTMLAYMDDILEPNDNAEIGQKIEESEFASNLFSRTRDVLRRMRLGAPPVLGRGMGQDPNTVAEYLDNTMPSERVADFEKVCLESDIHLAETAACHQVLTLVLGQPADVSRVSRERMYRIPEIAAHAPPAAALVIDEAHEPPVSAAAVAANTTAAAPPPAAAQAPRPRPDVPDYLRESARSRRRKQALVMIAVLTLFGFGAMALVRPDLLGMRSEVASSSAQSDLADEPNDVDSDLPGQRPAATDNATDERELPPTDDTNNKPLVLPDEPGAPADVQRAAPDGALVAPPLNLPPSDPIEPESEVPVAPDPGAPLALPPANNGLGETGEPDAETTLPETGVDPPLEATLPPATDAAGAGQQIGIYVPDKNVLLRLDHKSNTWQRLPPRSPVLAGDQLLSLPTFRPTITLSDGMAIQLAGGTAVTLEAPDVDGRLGLRIHYGRVVLIGAGRGGGEMRLLLNDKEQFFGFADANATLAIKAQRTLAPGSDPTEALAPMTGDAYVASGVVVWDTATGPVEVPAPAHWQLPEGGPNPQAPVGELPEWINGETLSLTDKLASQALETALVLERPISLSLAELVNGRRSEVRGLAVRSSVNVGQFEPFVAALSDLDQRGTWDAHIETLRSALALGPQVAEQVREALVQKRGDEDGQALYRMLWSYSDEQLEAGAAKELVDFLKHDQRDFRVLAAWNLKAITGLGPDYRPEYSEARHQRTVDRWRERLVAGEIQWPQPSAGQ